VIVVVPKFGSGNLSLTALRLAEERACAGYLAARKDMLRLRARVVTVGRLVTERPRPDYHASLRTLATAHGAAVERTRLAYARWQQTQRRSDAYWTATVGRAA
jgi:hypothetical protein